MEKYQILVVEDENDVNHLLANILEPHVVTSAYSGTEAKLLLGQNDYDLVMLDLMLPGMTGEELITWMRDQGKMIPTIVLSAKSRCVGRVKTVQNVNADGENSIVIGDLVLNHEQRTVYAQGQLVSLTVREFEILELLMTYPKKVFTRENLFTAIWGED